MPNHCEICDYTFVDGMTLKRHNTRLHPQQKKIQSKCNLCDYLYYTTEALEKHTLDIHRGNPTTGQKRQQKKTYECQVCGSPFSQNVSLQYHMKKYHLSNTDHESSASDEETNGGNNSSDSDPPTELPDCPLVQDTAQNIERHDVTDVTLMESESVQKLSNRKEIHHGVDLAETTKPLHIHTKSQTNTTCHFETLKMEVCDGDSYLECDEAMATPDNSDLNIETAVKCEVEHSDSTEDIEEEDLMSIYQDLNITHKVNGGCNNIRTESLDLGFNDTRQNIGNDIKRNNVIKCEQNINEMYTENTCQQNTGQCFHTETLGSKPKEEHVCTDTPVCNQSYNNIRRHIVDVHPEGLLKQHHIQKPPRSRQHCEFSSNDLDTFITHMTEKRADIKHSYIPLTRCDKEEKIDLPSSVHPHTQQAMQAQTSNIPMISAARTPAFENNQTKNGKERKRMTSPERREKRRMRDRERRKNRTSEEHEKEHIKRRERRKNMTTQRENKRERWQNIERKIERERQRNMTITQRENKQIREGERDKNSSQLEIQLTKDHEWQQDVMEQQEQDHILQENETMQAQTSNVPMISAARTPAFENNQTKNGKERKRMTSPERREKRRMRARERRKNRTSEEREIELNKRRTKNMTPTQREYKVNKERERRRNMTSTEREIERKKDHERHQNMTCTQPENKQMTNCILSKNTTSPERRENRLMRARERHKNRTSEERENKRMMDRERRRNMTSTQRENRRKKERERRQNMTATDYENRRIKDRERHKNMPSIRLEIQLRKDREWQQNVMEEQDHFHQENESDDLQGSDLRATVRQCKRERDRERQLNMTEEQKAMKRLRQKQHRLKQAQHLKSERGILVLERQKIQDRMKQEATDRGGQGTSSGQFCDGNESVSIESTHPTVQDDGDAFGCSACQFKTLHLNHLLSHFTREHKELNLITTICKVCGFRTNNSTELETHIATYSHDKCFTCEQCSATFLQRCRLTQHIRNRHESSKVLCPHCGRKYHATSLRSHILRKHTTGTPCLCNECGVQFSNQDKLNRHIQNAHIGPLSCKLCDYTCKRQSTFQLHMDKHLGIKPRLACDICGMGHEYPSLLREHMLSHSDDKPFKCNQCEYSSYTKSNVGRHVDRKHRNLKPHACDLCDYRVFEKVALQSHKQHKHNIGEVKMYKCTEPGCDYASKWPTSLRFHTLLHHGDGLPYKFHCSHCEFKAYSKKGLHDHILTHTGEKPFECPHCGFRCNVISNLRSHIKTHAKAENKANEKLPIIHM